jgi:hypothetical protein
VKRGGKRKGAGRKPTGKVAMLVRVSPEVRERLDRDARRAGSKSLSSYVERQLADALRVVAPADKQTRALCYLITGAVECGRAIERAGEPEFSWRGNRFDFEALKSAVIRILDGLAPAGTVESSRYPGEPTPEDMGRTMAMVPLSLLRMDKSILYAHGDRYGKERGSLFYAYPQAARDLDLTTGEDK